MAEIFTIKVGIVEAAPSSQSNESTTEIDNHADTAVLGSNCQLVHDFEISLDVYGCDASAGSVECTTIFKDIACDHPISGKVYILVYHQTIYFPRIANHLMCPMQIRMSRVRINALS